MTGLEPARPEVHDLANRRNNLSATYTSFPERNWTFTFRLSDERYTI